jgi:hypothetical protein
MFPDLYTNPQWTLQNAFIDMDFQNGRYFNRSPADLTVTNASGGYVNDSAGNWKLIPANVPRIGAGTGLLVEEQRINLCWWSNALNATRYTQDHVVLTTAQTSPDGLSTASLVTDDTTATIAHRVIPVDSTTSFTSGSTYTLSIFALAGGANPAQYIQLTGASAAFGSAQYATFDITNKAVVGASTTGGTASITTYSNGWMRLSFAVAASATTTGNAFVLSGNPANSNSRSPSYTGTSLTYYIWQPQVELGTWATSPIITTGAGSATRNADVVTLKNPPHFGSASSNFASGQSPAPQDSGVNKVLLDISDGGNSNAIRYVRNINGILAVMRVGNSTVKSAILNATWSPSVSGKAVGSYGVATADSLFNGGAVSHDTSTAPAAGVLNTVGIGGNGSSLWNGFITRVSLWPSLYNSVSTLQRITS